MLSKQRRSSGCSSDGAAPSARHGSAPCVLATHAWSVSISPGVTHRSRRAAGAPPHFCRSTSAASQPERTCLGLG